LLFDKWDLKPLSFRERPGSIRGKIGSRRETQIVRKITDAHRMAVRSDLTNCIRYGDIAVQTGQEPLLIEVKSGPARSDRAKRQINAISKISRYFATDEIDGLYGSPHISRVAAGSTEVTHMVEFNRLLEISRTSGMAAKIVEPGLLYIATATSQVELVVESILEFRMPHVIFLNQCATTEEWSHYYPFSLSFYNPDDAIDFLQDDLLCLVVIDHGQVEDIARELGYSTTWLKPDSNCAARFEPISAKGELEHITLSQYHFYRIGLEFTSLRWLLLEALQHLRAVIDQRSVPAI
jgi:hypothetical protein